ncbi:MAG: biotin--acetyl-CoA-carboxylase ligase [Gammaproteobacteria bacterium]|nr:biotin--acetyl-CoA-carboxylase ligase [Gammaproteobacteria bacterium]
MRIFPVGLALFILIPIIELYVLIKVGSYIGALSTIGLVLLTAVIGLNLLRHQGISTLNQVQAQMQRGEIPATGMLEGMLIFFAGAMLLTPGFVTDTVGFLLMIPPLRKVIALWLLEHSGWIVKVQTHTTMRDNRQQERHTLEGDYKRRDD